MDVHEEGLMASRFPLHSTPVEMPAIRTLLRACVQEQASAHDWFIDLVHGWGYSLRQSEQAHAQECAEQLVAALSPQFAACPAIGAAYRQDANHAAPHINTLALATLVDQCQYGPANYHVAFAALEQFVNHWGASLLATNRSPAMQPTSSDADRADAAPLAASGTGPTGDPAR